VPVEQHVGNAALLLDAFGERRIRCVDIANVEDEIGLERSERAEIDVVAVAAGEPRNFRQRGALGEEEFAFLLSDRFQPPP
jgi:hypothetical protein